jgi:hypothetical protein
MAALAAGFVLASAVASLADDPIIILRPPSLTGERNAGVIPNDAFAVTTPPSTPSGDPDAVVAQASSWETNFDIYKIPGELFERPADLKVGLSVSAGDKYIYTNPKMAATCIGAQCVVKKNPTASDQLIPAGCSVLYSYLVPGTFFHNMGGVMENGVFNSRGTDAYGFQDVYAIWGAKVGTYNVVIHCSLYPPTNTWPQGQMPDSFYDSYQRLTLRVAP